ncbi:hypothetical protein HB662_13905 [Roseomonas frigidaquae]|uniref:Uncharacterized protein n=1 Tax=Falsiroseomonas frigidaquae TaxID=487318 RepID=A0ABX1F0L0_9PROT|nr:hypothetical protein [Falsiroseomonas frigidaquae]NKE45881.1 hypothetical protein [Falsiroseomonas frigidaquae]
MVNPTAFAMVLALAAAPGLALAQSAPINGPNAAAVHGQNWNMRQDLSSSTATDGLPLTRTQRLRQQAAEAEARRRAQQRPTR